MYCGRPCRILLNMYTDSENKTKWRIFKESRYENRITSKGHNQEIDKS